MRKLFYILGLFATLSVGAQTTINPSNSNICFGQSVTLVASVMGYNTDTLNFNWYVGTTLQGSINDTITITPSTVGNNTVTVQVTDSVGNSTQPIGTIAFATIFVNALPTVTLTPYGPFCSNGASINLPAQPNESPSGGVFKVNGILTNIYNPNFWGVGTDTIAYTYTDGNGCSTTTTVNVSVNAPPTINSITPSPVLCFGGSSGSATVNATGSGLTYAWNTIPVQTTATATGLIAGNYAVTVTNNTACTATANTMVTQPSTAVSANALVISNVSCFGGNTGAARAVATGGTGNYSFNWLPGGIQNDTATSLVAGIYTAFVTDANGCPASASITIGQPTSAVTVNVDSIKSVSCFGGTNGKIYVTPSGGTTPYSYSWTGGNTSQDLLNVGFGTYTLTLTDANGCTATTSANILQPSTPVGVAASGSNILCFGGTTAINAVAAGGTAPYTYLWNGSLNGPTQTVSAGNYIVVATDVNGCNTSDTVTITQPSQVSFTYTQVNVLCNGNNTGSIMVTANGGVGNYQYRLNSGPWVTNNTFNNLTAGTYTIMARDANQCTVGPTTVIITQPNALQATVGSTPQGCTYLGQAWVIPSGGVGPYTFQWNNSLGTNDSIQAAAGNYTVTITDANNCQTLGIAAIATPQPVGITGTVTNPTCFGNSNASINITVTGMAPITYLWSNGDTTEDITGLGAPSSLTVIATAANGCIGSASYSLVNPAPLNVSSNNDTTSCFGSQNGSLTAMATGGTGSYGFSWSPSGGSGNIAYGLGAGIYTVVVTDANGCQATDQGQVFNAPQLAVVINSVTNSQCAGSNTGAIDITVTGGSGLLQYYWFGPNVTGSPSQDISNLAPGTYSVNITDENACLLSSPSITVGGGTQVITAYFTAVQNTCSGQNNGAMTINASGGTPPFSYQWSNGDTTAVNNNLAAGNYTVTITDAVGCQYGPMGQTVLVNPAMNITIPAELTNYCVGSGVPQGLNISGGTYPYTTQWENPNGVLIGTSDQIEPLLSGIYTATVIDGLACSQTVYVPVTLVTCTSGINDLSSENITIFPNPTTSGQATLSLPSTIHDVNIDVKNITGQSVFHAQTSDAQYTINTSSLAAGTYIVQIASRDKVITKKLVVQ